MNNTRQVSLLMHFYTEDNRDTFPGHRNGDLNTDDANRSLTNWWGTTIQGYRNYQTNIFKCPAIQGRRLDNGIKWEWKFDCHNVALGMNAFFLGIHPYGAQGITVGGVSFSSSPWFKRSGVLNPSQNICLGEAMPKSDGMWSSSLWWPTACMDAKASGSKAFEGIDFIRHKGGGQVLFNDGHAEFKKDKQINPPVDPSAGDKKGLINSRYWDPLVRADQ